jgi:hypothetical protein
MKNEFIKKGYTNNRWLQRYFRFIEYCRNSESENNEVHHILPRAIFPEYEKTKNNLVSLSYREHIIAHYMLAKAVGGTMWFPVILMSYRQFNSRLFETAKKESNKVRKEYVTVYDIDNQKHINILIKDYNPYNHITNSRKYSPMPFEYLKSLYIKEFNEKYNTNFLPSEFNNNYIKAFQKIRLSIRQKGKNNIIHKPEVKAKMKKSLAEYYKHNSGHNLGKKASAETKARQSISAKNRKQPSRRKQYNLISPDGVTYFCDGNLGERIEEFQLSVNTIKKFINSVVPIENRKRYNTSLRNNTSGWCLTEVQ